MEASTWTPKACRTMDVEQVLEVLGRSLTYFWGPGKEPVVWICWRGVAKILALC